MSTFCACAIPHTAAAAKIRAKILGVTRENDRKATQIVTYSSLFSAIASNITKIAAGSNVVSAFEVLCKKRSASCLVGIITGLTKDDAKFIDSNTNWANATRWVEWWMRSQHLKLLHKDYSEMDESVWKRCPSDTNAVERKNLDSKESLPQQLQIAMTNLYKYDKAACAKHIAANVGVSVTYCDQSQEARKAEAAKRNMRRQSKSSSDLTAQYGPPDRQCHFENGGKKRKNPVKSSIHAKRPKTGFVSQDTSAADDDSDFEDNTQTKFHQPNPNYLGRRLQMRFKIKETGNYQWFNGQILNFDPNTGKYGAFFPSDGQTVYINPSQEADDIVFYK